MLVDCKNPGLGQSLRREVEAYLGSDATLAQVVLTHHHHDHSGGNPAFTPDLPLYGHLRGVEKLCQLSILKGAGQK